MRSHVCRLRSCIAGGALLVLWTLSVVAAGATAQAARTVWDGVYTTEQATRGRQAFVRSCGGCHRDDMSGGDDSEPALRGPHFAGKWDGAPVAALYDFIANNMPRSKPGSVPLQDCVDIVAYILQSNEMPAGEAALTTSLAALDAITFTATRPTR